MNAAIPNPYLNPAENPATALPRLLQLVPLLAYLRAESGFMQESAMDYRDAAGNLVER